MSTEACYIRMPEDEYSMPNNDPWINLAMSIVGRSIKDLVIGYTNMLYEFGEFDVENFRARHAEKHEHDLKKNGSKKRYQPPRWIYKFEKSNDFIGNDWYYALVDDLDPGKVHQLAKAQAIDIWKKRTKEEN